MDADREVPDRHAIDDGYSRLELGFRLEPGVPLLPGAFSVRGLKLAGEQLRGVRAREAAVVIALNCISVVGGGGADFDRFNLSILTRSGERVAVPHSERRANAPTRHSGGRCQVMRPSVIRREVDRDLRPAP